MKRDLTQVLIGYDKKQVTWEDGKPVTLGQVCCRAMVGPEQGLGEEEMERRFAFAGILTGETEHDFSAKELGEVRKRILATFASPALVAPALRLLEIKEPTPQTK